jgi:Xaa-Pro aminopeptidase
MLRKTALKKSLSRLGVSGLLITDPVNVRSLTGFSGSSGFLLITKDTPVFVTDFRYKEQASMEVKGYRIVIENSARSLVIKTLCEKHKITKLGFEENDIRYGFYSSMKRNRIKLKPLKDTVERLRIIKSDLEISKIRIAVKRAEKAYRRLIPHIKKGVTEKSIAARLVGYLTDEGCSKLPFDPIVASGPMSAMPHSKPSGRKLKSGDLLMIDWGGEYEGYFSDMTRTLLINGKNIEKKRELYSIVLEAQRKAISSIRDGVKASVVDAAARDHLNSEGLEDYFGHATGHGVGLAVHEKPIVSWRSKDAVKNGMVFTIEPGIYIPDLGGVRIEDMVLVTRNGAEVLNKLSTRLKIIER